jgi:hypothetical protein
MLATLYSSKGSTLQACRPLKGLPYFSVAGRFTLQPKLDGTSTIGRLGLTSQDNSNQLLASSTETKEVCYDKNQIRIAEMSPGARC